MKGLDKRKVTTTDKKVKNTMPTKPNVKVLHAVSRIGKELRAYED